MPPAPADLRQIIGLAKRFRGGVSDVSISVLAAAILPVPEGAFWHLAQRQPESRAA